MEGGREEEGGREPLHTLICPAEIAPGACRQRRAAKTKMEKGTEKEKAIRRANISTG